MDKNLIVLGRLADLLPAMWDAIDPQHGGFGRSFGAEVALNPQPLPPQEIQGVLAGARMLEMLVERHIVAGGGEVRGFDVEIDGWCGTGWPRHWPFPWPGPQPSGIDPKIAAFTGAAAMAAGLALRYEHTPEIQKTLLGAAEQLTAQAVRG